jgi:hypothetical protein
MLGWPKRMGQGAEAALVSLQDQPASQRRRLIAILWLQIIASEMGRMERPPPSPRTRALIARAGRMPRFQTG